MWHTSNYAVFLHFISLLSGTFYKISHLSFSFRNSHTYRHTASDRATITQLGIEQDRSNFPKQPKSPNTGHYCLARCVILDLAVSSSEKKSGNQAERLLERLLKSAYHITFLIRDKLHPFWNLHFLLRPLNTDLDLCQSKWCKIRRWECYDHGNHFKYLQSGRESAVMW